MKTYIGTKVIKATPMTRAAYNQLRGWVLPEDESGADAGYLVEYIDGGKPNLDGYDGYVSWSPKAQFEGAYRETTGLTFGLAIEAMKKGAKVARVGWNGKGMWLRIFTPFADKQFHITEHEADPKYGDSGTLIPWIGMRTATNQFVPWLASQTDMLADDWLCVGAVEA
ncbi:MAG: DUF2829 domain-containing protein [Comamonadaceae bacterium]|nr:DUF2829 domain-containing protein [Comamonadaceae bacterium]